MQLLFEIKWQYPNFTKWQTINFTKIILVNPTL